MMVIYEPYITCSVIGNTKLRNFNEYTIKTCIHPRARDHKYKDGSFVKENCSFITFEWLIKHRSESKDVRLGDSSLEVKR